MEKWNDSEITKDQFIIDRIEHELVKVCEEWQIDDLKSEGQRVWKAVLQEIGERLFKYGDLKGALKDKALIKTDNDIMAGNDNKYDYDLLLTLTDYYLKLSNRYKKLSSTIAFSNLFNISQFTVDKWGMSGDIDLYNNIDINSIINNNNADINKYNIEILTYKRLLIHKKIKQGRLDCVLDKSFDSNNVMGAMYLGNTEFGLNMPFVRESGKNDRQLIDRGSSSGEALPNSSSAALPELD